MNSADILKKPVKKTKLLIIGSRRYKKSTVKSLIEEGKKVFDAVLFVPVHKIKLIIEKNEVKLFYKEKNLLEFAACYPRLSSKDYYSALPVLKVLENSKVYCPVNMQNFIVSNHKYFTIRELAKANIPVVESSLFISPDSVKEAVDVLGYPVVIKLISGFAGKGVMLIKDQKQLESILDTVHLFEDYVSAQKFIADKQGDVRCYVIGEKVIAVARQGKASDWRANVSRGGTAHIIEPSLELTEMVLTAAKLFAFDICSVDVIEDPSSPTHYSVLEVNFMPGPFTLFLGNIIPKEVVQFMYSKTSAGKQKLKQT
ncbi:MAG: RimK family alpha-L-glutamate ligase [Candidatus Diapherotrites archaeon]|nr:RimK family alpha-L-glutamate ligase [Candidatus Diapherotrites archaeon]